MKVDLENEKKADWVFITISGNPELAKEIKDILGLFLDWAILNSDQFVKARPFLKHYDQTTSLTNKNRMIFGLARKLERNRGAKAGFRLE